MAIVNSPCGTYQGLRSGTPGLVRITSKYCDEAKALFARMNEQPSKRLKILINTTILSLKAVNYWNKLDCYVMCNLHTAQASLLNWKGDTYNLTAVNSPVWTAKSGFKGAVTKYLRTGLTPSAGGTQFAQTSNIFGVYDPDGSTDEGSGIFGYSGGVAPYYLRVKRSANNYGYTYNNTTSYTQFTNTILTGLFVNYRNGDGYQYAYRDKTIIASQVKATEGLCTGELCVNTYNAASNCGTHRISNVYFGSGLIAVGTIYDINIYFNNNVGETF